MSTIARWCGCCKLLIHDSPPDNECPRCHYPVELQKEEDFLWKSTQDLSRILTYQPNILTIRELVAQYRDRLALLQREQQAVHIVTPSATTTANRPQPITHEQVASTAAPDLLTSHIAPSIPRLPPASAAPVTLSSENMKVAPEPIPQATRQMFSLRSFLEDQTINIVASLGAFLILAGSLSFVATTTNLLFSFIVMLLVHAIFGGVGLITQKYTSFRMVSLIYTAIFALLIPLVSFSAYRLAANSQVIISPPALVAMVTAYAAIAYGSLAIYQRFNIFSYLALAALSIADLATAYAFELSLPWLFCSLMPLALLAILCLPKDKVSSSIFDGRLAIFREPLTIAMYVWGGICGLGALLTTLIALLSSHSLLTITSTQEARIALCVQIALLLLWHAGMAWRTRKAYWVISPGYLFVALALALALSFSLPTVGYALVLVSVATCYHVLVRFAPAFMQTFKPQALETHLETTTLVLVMLVPLVGMPDMPTQLHLRAFAALPASVPTNSVIGMLIACALGLLITLSATAHHTRLLRQPQGDACWLLLLSSFMLYWGCGTLLLKLPVHPLWLFLGITLALIALAFIARRVASAHWGTPLEVIACVGTALTLYFSLNQSDTLILALLLGFEGIYYLLALSQRRPGWLALAMTMVYLSLMPLFFHRSLLFALSLGLPLCAAWLRISYHHTYPTRHAKGNKPPLMTWELVFLVQGFLYGIIFAGIEFFSSLLTGSTSALTSELHIPFPTVLEMALLAGSWYLASAIMKKPVWLIVATFFAFVAVSLPGNTFQFQCWLAPLSILVALGVRIRFGRAWSAPLALTAILATLMVGLNAQVQQTQDIAIWVLLGCAALYYLAGIISRELTVTALTPATLLLILCILPHPFTLFVWIAPISILLVVIARLALGRPSALSLAACALIATITVGIQGQAQSEITTAAWILLLCAQLFYLGGFISREPSMAWLSPVFTTWSVYYAGMQGDLYRPALIALIFALLGIISKYVVVFRGEERAHWHSYRLPLYATALASALLTGLYGSYANVNVPFYTAVPDILVLYALLAYIVLLNERRIATLWQGIVPGFAVWSLLLAFKIETCDQLCTGWQTQRQGLYMFALTLSLGIIGLMVGRLASRFAQQASDRPSLLLHYNWGWYSASLFGIVTLSIWQNNHYTSLFPALLASLLILSIIIMLVERVPEVLILCSALALWLISDLHWVNWQQALAYSGLTLLIFSAQWLWQKHAPTTHWLPARGLSLILSLGGQSLVIGNIINQGGLSKYYPELAHSGAFALLVLASLVGITGYLQHSQGWHRWCYYSALILLTGALSWELVALQQARFDVLTLPLATGFILIATFLQRDERLPHQRLGARLGAVTGAILLLLPTLWLSFSESNLSPTLLLGGEALVLLLVGIGTRIRVFVLSGAALVIIAGMHALFLPTLGLPPSLALAILGLTLLALATALSLARHRLRSAWTQWQ